MRKSWEFILLAFALLTACAPSEADIDTAVKHTQAEWTIVPSQTPYPTYIPYPTLKPLPTQSPTLPPDSSGMASIPAGEFLMGCDPSSSVAPNLDGESPPYLLHLEQYNIVLTEVSITQYKQCVMEEVCRPPDFGESDFHIFRYLNPEYSDHPITGIDWYDARQYCTWRGKRLPSEAEWEKAARGAEDERFFPWGSETPDCTLTNFNGLNESCPGETTPVGEYLAGASPYGALNMVGNVREWVADWYDANRYFSPDSESPHEYDPGGEKVLRGGSYNSDWNQVRVNYRGHNPPTHFSFDTGFRCVMDP